MKKINLFLSTRLKDRRSEVVLLAGLILLSFVLMILSPYFMTTKNLTNIMRQTSINGIISIGMSLVVLSGGIDLSVGSVLAFSGMIVAMMSQLDSSWGGVGVAVGILFSLISGIGLGGLNGLLIGYFKVPPFVSTLGMMSIARGITYIFSDGQPIPNLQTGFLQIGIGTWLGIPIPFYLFLVIFLIFNFFLRRSPWGRNLYAVGGNESCAYLSGINTQRYKLIIYSLSGMLAAVSGIVLTARTTSGLPQAGVSYELDAIAAVVIGGMSLNGGKGSLFGTFLGVILIGVLNNGLNLLGVSSYYQQVAKGMIIILAVMLDFFREKLTD